MTLLQVGLGDVCVSPFSLAWECFTSDWTQACKGATVENSCKFMQADVKSKLHALRLASAGCDYQYANFCYSEAIFAMMTAAVGLWI